ncbi:hypothetical protein BS50DRAFT_595394 [Corynespora cassiicola Philippines]|uniref:Phospholipid/glycerol acyltransferase domain-containing protein n=1 Tax=Corynespora cassiicola Philippines TaxID=1448308 RepID=A0A2T2P872_CORCC|nr:hypothetical protein BS50DRAFT_595394 [Corynespora cassiicola Philippines]
MEKYSQFRDKGTAIAPFLPVPTPPTSPIWAPVHALLFLIRAPAVFFLSTFYFLILEWVPVGQFVRKCVLWLILAIPGVWWVDLQVDGVKRGKLGSKLDYLPHPGTIIASSFTSPLDPLYLAGIFHPIFTRAYPSTRKVERITLFSAILLAFAPPRLAPKSPSSKSLTTLKELQARNPNAIICVFPECTTTNGRGILPFSPALLTADPKTKIYPVSLRYTPGDITTPVPGNMAGWIWKLLSKPTHALRVRVARHVYNNDSLETPYAIGEKKGATARGTGYEENIFESPHLRDGFGVKDEDSDADGEDTEEEDEVTQKERKVLDRVGEDLARLGRVKRVDLGVETKIEFVKVWGSRKR